MKWESFNILSIDSAAPEAVKEKAVVLETAVEQMSANRRELDADTSIFLSTDPTATDGPLLDFGASFGRRRFELLRREIELREEFHLLSEMYHVAIRSLMEESARALEHAENTLRKQLVKIGYQDCPAGEALEYIQPGMIFVHPTVIAARDRGEILSSDLRSNLPTFVKANREAISRVAEQMKEMRNKLAALVV